jgi:membrane-associated protein
MSLDPDLTTLTAGAVYLVVLGFVFVESGLLVGFFLPGDTLLFGGGLVAASAGSGVSLPLLVAGVVTAAITGDSVAYATGRRLGRPWLERRMRAGRLDGNHLRRAEGFFERYGWFAVVGARWVPWVRTFTPIIAGTSQMNYVHFLSANVVGALCWGVTLPVLGYYAASNETLAVVAHVTAAFFVTASLVAGGVGWWRRRRAENNPRAVSLES